MRLSRPVLSLLVAALLTCAGCAGIQPPEQAGFLKDYSKLEETRDKGMLYSSSRLGQYDRFMVDPVELLIEDDAETTPFTAEELEELTVYFAERIEKELTDDDGYAIVAQPGEGTARIRFGITSVKRTIGVLNISLVTKITGAGIGGASAEGEVLDTVSGDQIAAIIRWGGGSRVLRAGLTKSGDAKLAMNRWARDLRDLIDIAHGR